MPDSAGKSYSRQAYLEHIKKYLPKKYTTLGDDNLFRILSQMDESIGEMKWYDDIPEETPSFLGSVWQPTKEFVYRIPETLTATFNVLDSMFDFEGMPEELKEKRQAGRLDLYRAARSVTEDYVSRDHSLQAFHRWAGDNPFEWSRFFTEPAMFGKTAASVMTSLGSIMGAGAIGTLIGGPGVGAGSAMATAFTLEGGEAFASAYDKTTEADYTDEEIDKIAAEAGLTYGVLSMVLESLVPLAILKRFGIGLKGAAGKAATRKYITRYMENMAAARGGKTAQEVAIETLREYAGNNIGILQKIVNIGKTSGIHSISEAATEGSQYIAQEAIVDDLMGEDITLSYILEKMSDAEFHESLAGGLIAGKAMSTPAAAYEQFRSGTKGKQAAEIVEDIYNKQGKSPTLVNAAVAGFMNSDKFTPEDKREFASRMIEVLAGTETVTPVEPVKETKEPTPKPTEQKKVETQPQKLGVVKKLLEGKEPVKDIPGDNPVDQLTTMLLLGKQKNYMDMLKEVNDLDPKDRQKWMNIVGSAIETYTQKHEGKFKFTFERDDKGNIKSESFRKQAAKIMKMEGFISVKESEADLAGGVKQEKRIAFIGEKDFKLTEKEVQQITAQDVDLATELGAKDTLMPDDFGVTAQDIEGKKQPPKVTKKVDKAAMVLAAQKNKLTKLGYKPSDIAKLSLKDIERLSTEGITNDVYQAEKKKVLESKPGVQKNKLLKELGYTFDEVKKMTDEQIANIAKNNILSDRIKEEKKGAPITGKQPPVKTIPSETRLVSPTVEVTDEVLKSKDGKRVVAAKILYDENKILLNRKELKSKFEEKAWTKPKIEGVNPLPENTFKTYAQWEKFAIEHEKAHVQLKQDNKLQGSDLENEANRLGVINTGIKAVIERSNVPRTIKPTKPTQKVEFVPTIVEQESITRKDLKNNPDKIYLFGDNVERKGLGGQAKEMRGEPNAIGIATKKKPSNTPDSFFTDKEFEENKHIIDADLQKVSDAIAQGKEVVIPKAGIGTGLADLKKKAPKTYAYLQSKLSEILKGKKPAKPVTETTPVESLDDVELAGLTPKQAAELNESDWYRWLKLKDDIQQLGQGGFSRTARSEVQQARRIRAEKAKPVTETKPVKQAQTVEKASKQAEETLKVNVENIDEAPFQKRGSSQLPQMTARPKLSKAIRERLAEQFKGISVTEVESIVTKHGEEAVGRAFGTAIEYVLGKATIDTLPHEYMHIYADIFKNDPMVKKAKEYFANKPVKFNKNTGTHVAVSYGLYIRGNQPAIDRVYKEWKQLDAELKKGGLSEEVMGEKTFTAHAYREAYEAATNTGSVKQMFDSGYFTEERFALDWADERMAQFVGEYYANRIEDAGLRKRIENFLKYMVLKLKKFFGILEDKESALLVAEQFYRAKVDYVPHGISHEAFMVTQAVQDIENDGDPEVGRAYDEIFEDMYDADAGILLDRFFMNAYQVYIPNEKYADLIKVVERFKDIDILDDVEFRKFEKSFANKVEEVSGTKLPKIKNQRELDRNVKTFFQKVLSRINIAEPGHWKGRKRWQLTIKSDGNMVFEDLAKENPATGKMNDVREMQNFLDEDSANGINNMLIYINSKEHIFRQDKNGKLRLAGNTFRLTAADIKKMNKIFADLHMFQPTDTVNTYKWARKSDNSYEVSSQGDKRFSAFYAQLSDGRYIEDIYQLDIKGNGKAVAKPITNKQNPVRSTIEKTGAFTRNVSKDQSWNEYKQLWIQYLDENPKLLSDLREKAKGKVLTDKFATTDVSQARALAEILNESGTTQAKSKAGRKPLFFFFASTSGDHASIAISAIAPQYADYNREQFESYLRDEEKKGLLEDKHINEMLKSADVDASKNPAAYAQALGVHRRFQSILGLDYLKDESTVANAFKRLKLHLTKGTLVRGIGNSSIFTVNSNEVVFMAPDENGEMKEMRHLGTRGDGTNDFDGWLQTSQSYISKIGEGLGLSGNNGIIVKSVIRSLDRTNMHDMIAVKMMEQIPFKGTKVYKLEDGLRVLIAEYDGYTWKNSRTGERFDRLASQDEVKQSRGKYAEKYKVVQLPEDATRVISIYEDSKNSGAFPILMGELSLHDMFMKTQEGKAFVESVNNYYEMLASNYVDTLYNFRNDPKALKEFLDRELQSGQLPPELKRYIDIFPDGEGLFIMHVWRQWMPMLNRRLINDGLFKGRSLKKNTSTHLKLKPSGNLNINDNNVIVSADNRTMVSLVMGLYDGPVDIKALMKSDRHGAIKQLNEWLSKNEVNVLIHRQPIQGFTKVQPRRIQQFIEGKHGQAVFLSPNDVFGVHEADFDGDFVFLEYFPEGNLIPALAEAMKTKAWKELNKGIDLNWFKTNLEGTSLANSQQIINAIADSASMAGSQGLVVNSKTMLTVMSHKQLKFTIPGTNKEIAIYNPDERVVMDYWELNDLNQLTEEQKASISENGDKIIAREKDGKVKYYLETTKAHEFSILLQAAVDNEKFGLLSAIKLAGNDNLHQWLMRRIFKGPEAILRSVDGKRAMRAIYQELNHSSDRQGVDKYRNVRTMEENIDASKKIASLYFNPDGSKKTAEEMSSELLSRLEREVTNSLTAERMPVQTVNKLSVNDNITPLENLMSRLALEVDKKKIENKDEPGIFQGASFLDFSKADFEFAHVESMKTLSELVLDKIDKEIISKKNVALAKEIDKAIEFTQRMGEDYRAISEARIEDMKKRGIKENLDMLSPKFEYDNNIYGDAKMGYIDFINKYYREFKELSSNQQYYSTMYFLEGIRIKSATGKSTKEGLIKNILPIQLMSEKAVKQYGELYYKNLMKPYKQEVQKGDTNYSTRTFWGKIEQLTHCS